MIVRWILRPRVLATLVGAGLGAVAVGQIETWIRGIWTFDIVLLAACACAALSFYALSLTRGIPVTHGSARFRRGQELRTFHREEGLIVGRDGPNGKLLRYDGPGHLLTIAPTRAGKGVGAIIPNLLTADRPAIVIDPKGENFAVSRRTRSTFGPVYVLDPFGTTGVHGVAYNPLTGIDPDGDRFLEDATDIAEAIVSDPGGDGGAAHWNEEARALITGLILHCASSEPPEYRHLGRVREYLTLPPDGTELLLAAMQENTAAGGLVARAANRRLQQNEREASSILSTAQRHTHFLDSPLLSASLSRTDFTFREVAEKCGSVFLVLPPDRLHAHARWLRLLTGRALVELMRDTESRKPVLLMLDECAALGRMKPIEQALGLAAGYRVQLWSIFQDLHQLRATYGRTAETFLSNAGIVQVFNVNDVDTARWVSTTLGNRTVPTSVRGFSAWTGRPLLTSDEISSMDPDRMLILPQEGRPILAWKPRYYTDAEFAGAFDAAS